MTAGFKSGLLIVAGAIGALAVAMHMYAPELMKTLGQAIHGGR
jgi:hypothetical protein